MTTFQTKTEYVDALMAMGRPAVLKLTRSIGIRAGDTKDTRAICEHLWTVAQVNRKHEIRRRVLALVAEGQTPVDALRSVCGPELVDTMIGELYTELRAKAVR